MIVKREESAQVSIFPEKHRPIYKNCPTCARLIVNTCAACGVPYTTSTPWHRMSEMKTPKRRILKLNTPESVMKILEDFRRNNL